MSSTRRSTIATTGRPGPVVIDIPKDVQFATGPIAAGPFQSVSYRPQTKGDRGADRAGGRD
jgi:acetolactate synthase-1/2/3 large subunit